MKTGRIKVYMENLIITAKIRIPPLQKDYITRPEIVKKLQDGLSTRSRLTMVAAPPGYGKTSVVAEWLNEYSENTAWLQLDENDNDLWRFFGYLVAALKACDSNISLSTVSLLNPSDIISYGTLINTLINSLASLSKKIILVLDDYHVIHLQHIHDVLQAFIDYQHDLLHLIVISRENPPISLSRLRARGQLTEIRADQLRFSLDETMRFFNSTLDFKISQEHAGVLETQTEGWITGLKLAGLSLRERSIDDVGAFIKSFSGNQRYIIDYLFEEVINGLEADLRCFLYQISILERFTSDLCNTVTERTDSKVLIAKIRQANLFILSLDENGQWYRFHHLFLEILRSELDKKQKILLNERAGQWFWQNGYVEEAANFSLAAGKYTQAAFFIEKAAIPLIKKGEVRTLLQLIGRLPYDYIVDNTSVMVYKSWCLLQAGKHIESAGIIEHIESKTHNEMHQSTQGILLLIKAYIAIYSNNWSISSLAREAVDISVNCEPFVEICALDILGRVLMHEGDFNASIDAFHLAYKTGINYEYYNFAFTCLRNTAYNMISLGKRKEAEALCRQVLDKYGGDGHNPMQIADLICVPLGIACYLRNELDEALAYLSKGLALCQSLSLIYFEVQTKLMIASVQYSSGLTESAFETIQNVYDFIRVHHLEGLLPLILSTKAELLLRKGKADAALKCMDNYDLSILDEPDHINEKQCTIYARILIAKNRYDECTNILDKLEISAAGGGRRYRLITVYTLKCVLMLLKQDKNLAVKYLTQAVDLAASEDLYRPFLDEDPAVLRLLPEIRHVAPLFINNLSAFTKIPDTSGITSGKAGLIDTLSSREMEILELMATGLTNMEISEKLYISVSTTKWHVSNVFSKLGVKNRIQAIEKTKKMQLL